MRLEEIQVKCVSDYQLPENVGSFSLVFGREKVLKKLQGMAEGGGGESGMGWDGSGGYRVFVGMQMQMSRHVAGSHLL